MALYRALVKCYVDNGIREEGDVFNYDGPENSNLELAEGKPAPEAQAVEESAPKKGFARKAAKAEAE